MVFLFLEAVGSQEIRGFFLFTLIFPLASGKCQTGSCNDEFTNENIKAAGNLIWVERARRMTPS